MGALEQEIIEKFHQLQPAAKQRVLALIEREVAAQTTDVSEFDYATWFSNVEAIRQQIYTSQIGKQSSVDVVGILREIRDGEDE
jgi:hypothetical protein